MQMSSLTLTVQIKLTLVAWIRENMYPSASLQNHSVTNKYINLFGMPYLYWLSTFSMSNTVCWLIKKSSITFGLFELISYTELLIRKAHGFITSFTIHERYSFDSINNVGISI